MPKSSGNRGGRSRGTGSVKRGGTGAGWPSKTGKHSGGDRRNAPRKMQMTAVCRYGASIVPYQTLCVKSSTWDGSYGTPHCRP